MRAAAPSMTTPRPRIARLTGGARRFACHLTVHLTVTAALALTTFALPDLLHAQDSQEDASLPTALLANGVSFDGEMLVATGDVEVLYDGTRLTASRISYNQTTGALSIDGPIRLTESGTDTVVLASAAELDTELKNGILTSARMVIDQQMQLAAARLDVIDGRYLRMQKSVASTCEVCANRPVPMWEIRAQEIVHDSEARQLYFTNAHVRIMDVPVLWLPHLRVPDPTLERVNGFLVPEVRTDSTLGTGIEIPYFITIGDHRDLTVSPYLATNTTTLNLRYRQAFTNGDIEINGAVSDDDTTDGLRAYAEIEGDWTLRNGYALDIDLAAVSDTTYLSEYDISDSNYLKSTVNLSRYRTGEAIDGEITYSRYLGEGTNNDNPTVLGEFLYERYVQPWNLPGRLSYGFTASSYYRESNDDVDGSDVLRLGAESSWSGSKIFNSGLRLDNEASVYADAYFIRQNSDYDSTVLRGTASAETKLSWPLTRSTASGASEILEPILQLGWSDSVGGSVPDTDSLFIEFDEGNLLTLARFPGADRRETGLTSAAGLRFSHYGPTFDYAVTLGRVLYLEDTDGYSTSSGLSTTQSDWLLAARMAFNDRLSLYNRLLLGNDAEMTKWDTRLDYLRDTYSIGTTYSYVIADAVEDRDERINEFALDGEVILADNWTLTGEYRHDFENDEVTRAKLGIKFQNECTRVQIGLTRRYWDTDDLDPTTRVTFSVGFGAFATEQTKASTCAF
ncbi:LPS-assembly protein LptD [Celeribacter sp.]|uniref:LPS-assembly protein LptD n=1 Tax=Celeribacter sp. TaxID=1890673 RepID=UPI003A8CBC85